MLRGGLTFGIGYGALGRELALPALVLVLAGAGVFMGYAARWAGGCTMAHGLCGSSVRSQGSLIAAGTFMTTAIGMT